MAQRERVDASAGALADDEIYTKIFHSGVEDFFHGGLQSVDFVEEEDFLGFQGGEDSGKVAFTFEERTGAGFYGDGKFVGNDLGQGGLAEAGRAVKENVVEGFVAASGRFYGDLDVFFYALLADVFVQALGADTRLDTEIFVDGGAGHDAGGLASCAGVWHGRQKISTETRQR